MMLATDWATLGPHAHAVQFYEHDDILVSMLARFVGPALVAGDAAVVIATKSHRDGLTRRLKSRGFDQAIARQQGRYVALDAADTLSKFMRNGSPDPRRFMREVGNVIERAGDATGEPHPRVVAFGEMVSLLWTGGQREAAIRVEELWNDLARTHTFSLCCAYPMNGFAGHTAAFLKICAQHSHVFPAERRQPPRRQVAS